MYVQLHKTCLPISKDEISGARPDMNIEVAAYVMAYLHSYISEPQHDKTNHMACAPSEDSVQSGHPLSLIRVLAVRSMGSYKDLMLFHADSEDSNRNGRMPRLT